MTVIAAIHDPDTATAWMLADTQSTTASGGRLQGASKIAIRSGALVGASGSLAYERWLHFRCPRFTWGFDSGSYVDQVADSWAEWSAGKELDTIREGTRYRDGDLLVATPDGLWQIDCAGGLMHIVGDAWAIGSGGPEARGALLATAGLLAPGARLLAAVEAACALDSGCSGRGEIMETRAPLAEGMEP